MMRYAPIRFLISHVFTGRFTVTLCRNVASGSSAASFTDRAYLVHVLMRAPAAPASRYSRRSSHEESEHVAKGVIHGNHEGPISKEGFASRRAVATELV